MSGTVAIVLTLAAIIISIVFFVLSRRSASGESRRSPGVLLSLGVLILILAVVFFIMFYQSA